MSEITKLIDEINEKQIVDETHVSNITDALTQYTSESDFVELFQLGDALMSFGHIYDAEKIFEYLHENGEHDDDIVAFLTDIYITDNRLDDALSLINSAPKTVVTLMIKAEIFQQLNMPDISFNLLHEARKLGDDVIIDFAIAELHNYEGNIVDAEEAYTKVLEKETEVNGVYIHLRLAKLYLLQMNHEKALEHYDLVEEEHFQNEDLHDKALAASLNEQYEMAKTLFTRVINNEPHMMQAYINLADIHEKENEIESAINVIKSYLVQDDQNAMMYSKLGTLHFKIDEVSDAIETLSRSIQIDGSYQESITRILEILLLSGRTEQLDQFEEYIDTDELVAENIYLLAKVAAENESYDDAERLYERAYEHLSHSVLFMTDYYYFLLEIASKESYSVLNQLILLEPDNIEWIHEKERLALERD